MTRMLLLAAGAAWLIGSAAQTPAWAGESGDPPPPHARPGQCFAKVVVPEQWETVPERVVDRPEHVETRTIPAEYGFVDKTVVTRPASEERFTVPATWRTVMETVVVRPPGVRLEPLPPVYEPVARQVLVREGRTVWKPSQALPGYGPQAPLQNWAPGWGGQTRVEPTGEILCLVYEPPLYRTVVDQVLRVPARTVEIPVPGETRVVPRQVVDTPAHELVRPIPAEYGRVRERVVVRPEREESFTVPATWRTIERRHLVIPAHTEWREAGCAPPPAPPPPPPPPVPMAPPCAAACAPVPPPPPPRRHASQECDICAPAPRGPVERERLRRRWTMDAPRPAARREASPQRGTVARLQSALAARGYYKGPVDGRYTALTRDGLVRFQRDHHFAEGELTAETARALDLPL